MADQALREEAVPSKLTDEEYKAFAEVKKRLGAGQKVSKEEKDAADAIATSLEGATYTAWEVAGKSWWPVADRFSELENLSDYLPLSEKYALAEAVYGFFANGGTECYVVTLAPDKDLGAELTAATSLEKLKALSDVNMVAVPDLWTNSQDVATGGTNIEKVVAHCVKMRNRLAIVEPPDDLYPSELGPFIQKLASPNSDDSAFTAVYYPWVRVPGVNAQERTVPPCGHMAGVWARTDVERGVFKAPANQNIRGVLSIPTRLTDGQQGDLNEKGINCLRVFPDRGLLVWGARTRSSTRDWQYVNVRRLVCFLRDSIQQSSSWAVFEPNDERLWGTLRHAVSTFLMDQWRQGALVGRTPEEAFYVICDGSNNPRETQDKGEVHCDIGVAPVRPAEFVHFSIAQIAGQAGGT
ncbi:phage tail sheath family protein [Streptomyces inhibens]|uniref:phage tail sheath family protein n=1 Tax=Streptomyces inhibens TaxID=2293571 RepID=UPI001EE6CD8D|nr:phage tail sheath subtilisin-like domain-containing protein [Streptomyces inhibens]UKY54040.1 phage tail sheath subtilisin-like domain-containing protein [Streptomyces inhibens]